MKNIFNESDALGFISQYPEYPEELALRVYTSRLVGADRDLVLHGGGNTSVKLTIKNILGEPEEVLFVKATGWDLATIEPAGFTGLRLSPLRRLKTLEALSPNEMENQVKCCRISADAPSPSVEALLHGFLPHKYVEHTHSDRILILTNQNRGEEMVKEALGDKIAILPYIASGFPLAKAAAAAYEKNPEIDGIVLMNHGIFTFAETARTSYEKMMDYVKQADDYIKSRTRNNFQLSIENCQLKIVNPESAAARCAQIIRGVCSHPGDKGKLCRLYTDIRRDRDLTEASLSKEADAICSSGMLTPHHAVLAGHKIAYIESVPEDDDALKTMIRQAADIFKKDYDHQLCQGDESNQKRARIYPRLFWIAGTGLVGVGSTRKAARIAADIGEHNIRAKLRAFAIGDYETVSDTHVLDIYRRMGDSEKGVKISLQGQIAVITGSDSLGIGIAGQFLSAGAAAVILDRDETRLNCACFHLAEVHDKDYLETVCLDIADRHSLKKGLEHISRKFGGVDIAVLNAAEQAEFSEDNVMNALIPIFKRQGTGGNIVILSKDRGADPLINFGARFQTFFGFFGSQIFLSSQSPSFPRFQTPEWKKIGVRVNRIICPNDGSLLPEHIGNAAVFFAGDLMPVSGAVLP